MILKEPLIAILFKKAEYMPDKMGVFIMQMVFEMFVMMILTETELKIQFELSMKHEILIID